MSRKIFLNRTRAKINSDSLEEEVQQKFIVQDDEVFINRLTELNALWSDLLEQKKSISKLREQLQCSVGNQLGLDATLDAIEQQLQQEFDKVYATLKPKFSKNVEIGLAAADNTTAVSGSPHKRARQCDDERSDEEILKVSSDNEQKHELPVGLPRASEHAMQLHSSPPKKQVRLDRKGKNSASESNGSESDVHIIEVNQPNNSKESTAKVALECQLAEETFPQLANFMKQSGDTLERRKRQPLFMRKRRDTFLKNTQDGRSESATHSCAECSKTFLLKSNLSRHLVTHTGEKPYKCEECGAAFTRNTSLTRHQRVHSAPTRYECQTIHTKNRKIYLEGARPFESHRISDENPFTCDVCSRSFRQKFNLLEHMYIHSGQKPYECKVCNNTFRQRSALHTHRKVHSDVRE
ncbi:zinc finger protein 354A-like [Bradysia coprophila]|uniref:zinc finger protein 354A-like n=1 Tax=Bradysia coprophila TaxID=38358 RepID=UPI00187D7175|nr:zinc finger protein 354A-like [Bradysia coprophila]